MKMSIYHESNELELFSAIAYEMRIAWLYEHDPQMLKGYDGQREDPFIKDMHPPKLMREPSRKWR